MDQHAEPDDAPPSRARGGFQVARIAGVPLVVSPWWIVIVVLITVGLPGALRDRIPGLGTATSYGVSFALVIGIYGSVLLHEASHVVVAKSLGMRVGRVVLQLLGAVSEVLEESATAGREFLVAAVGPLTSVLLAGVAAAVGAAFPEHSIGWTIGYGLAWTNGIVAAFNLLPGLPLDGGRVLRAILWQLTGDKMRGLLIAGWVGRGVAAAVFLLGLYAPSSLDAGSTLVGPVYLMIIAAFIYLNASSSIAQAKVGVALPTLSLARLVRPALLVEPQLPLAEAVRRAREGGARALVVIDSRDRWSGIVTESKVQAMPVERQPWVSVADLARPVEAGLVLSPTLDGEGLMAAITRTPASEYLVKAPDGTLAGVLARSDLVAALKAAGVH